MGARPARKSVEFLTRLGGFNKVAQGFSLGLFRQSRRGGSKANYRIFHTLNSEEASAMDGGLSEY